MSIEWGRTSRRQPPDRGSEGGGQPWGAACPFLRQCAEKAGHRLIAPNLRIPFPKTADDFRPHPAIRLKEKQLDILQLVFYKLSKAGRRSPPMKRVPGRNSRGDSRRVFPEGVRRRQGIGEWGEGIGNVTHGAKRRPKPAGIGVACEIRASNFLDTFFIAAILGR